jgi:hypothetical protein
MPDVPWYRRLRRHALFPILLYLPLSQAVRDDYPISHFPMYSNPTSKPLKIHSLTDAAGNLIPIIPNSGVTPSHMSKMFGGYMKDLIQQEERSAKKEKRSPRDELDFELPAAISTLEVLRKQSLKRASKCHLTQALQLRETQVSCGHSGFTETEKVLATLPAMEVQQP